MTLVDYVFGFLAVVWLTATAVAQCEGHLSFVRIKRFDVFNLLPRWTFFAPVPCVSDYQLVYRDIDDKGVHQDWTGTALLNDRPLSSAVWNPSKRKAKCLIDAVQCLRPFQMTEDLPLLSFPYLWLLNICMNYPRDSQSTARQFAVFSKTYISNGDESLSAVLVSAEHPF